MEGALDDCERQVEVENSPRILGDTQPGSRFTPAISAGLVNASPRSDSALGIEIDTVTQTMSGCTEYPSRSVGSSGISS